MIYFQYTDGIISIRNAKVISEKYNYITREQAVYAGNGKVNIKDIFVFINEKYLYVKLQKANPKIAMLTHLIIDGYFENPAEASNYTTTEGTTCYNLLDDDYPISDSLWVYMRDLIINNGLVAIQANKYETKNTQE